MSNSCKLARSVLLSFINKDSIHPKAVSTEGPVICIRLLKTTRLLCFSNYTSQKVELGLRFVKTSDGFLTLNLEEN